jgi:hypothetical protein
MRQNAVTRNCGRRKKGSERHLFPLEESLPEFERADVELAVPSQLVRLPEIATLHPASKK